MLTGLSQNRFHYSMRTLLFIVSAVAIFCSIANVGYPWDRMYIMALTLAFVGALFYAAVTGRGPGWPSLGIILATSVCVAYVLWSLDQMPPTTFVGAGLELLSDMLMHQLPMLPLLFSAWCMWRVIRRSPDDFRPAQIRLAAVASLLIGAILFSYGIAVFMMAHRMYPQLKYSHMALLNREMIVMYLVVAANFAIALPWIKIDRECAAKAKNRPNSYVDKGARWLLLASLVIAVPSGAVGLDLLFRHEHLGLPELFFRAFVLYLFPQFISSALFVVGTTIQLYRDRWHRTLTIASCFYFIPFWLLVVRYPLLLLHAS